ncbi:hypothetical protein WDU94_006823 [Cyamophila willieti]
MEFIPSIEVIENLIEEEVKQKLNNTFKRPKHPKNAKHPKNPKHPYRFRESSEGDSVENRGQQSQEKPLRMYYNGEKLDESDRHSKSIENYIDAHLDNSDEFYDTHEVYLKRRNPVKVESETHNRGANQT